MHFGQNVVCVGDRPRAESCRFHLVAVQLRTMARALLIRAISGVPVRYCVFAAVMLGALSGFGAYTFRYGEGLSYFSRDPRACANCHIMQPQFDSWQKSSHHTSAACIDCHLPHETIPKFVAKGLNGFFHSKAFTFQDFHEPITIKPRNSRILENNCIACHGALFHGSPPRAAGSGDSFTCVHCHAGVGHGPAAGIGGPETAAERRETPR